MPKFATIDEMLEMLPPVESSELVSLVEAVANVLAARVVQENPGLMRTAAACEPGFGGTCAGFLYHSAVTEPPEVFHGIDAGGDWQCYYDLPEPLRRMVVIDGPARALLDLGRGIDLPSHQEDDLEFPDEDWVSEVVGGNTRLGYAQWVASQREQLGDGGGDE